jgi:hypothetical protein
MVSGSTHGAHEMATPTDGDKAAAATVTAALLTARTVILYGETEDKVKYAATLYADVLKEIVRLQDR